MPLPFSSELAACRIAQEAWARRPVRERLRPVGELRRLLVERMDELLDAVTADVHRDATELLATDLLPTGAALKFLQQEAVRLLKPRRVSWRQTPIWLMGCRDVVHHRPWGVVGIIGTWNYPLLLNVVPMAQAFVAGNGVLWKPSEQTPRTGEAIARLFRDAGFPAGLLQTLPATREAGPQLAEAGIDHLLFVGSDGVGRKLAARLGERLVPSTMELSGCDALFVLADADLDLAADSVWFGVTLNRGQTCIAVRRVFVAREQYAAFAEKLKALAVKASPVPLQTPAQFEQARQLVKDAVAKGAVPLIRHDEETDGIRFTPTLLMDATVEMRLTREACFAPLAAVLPFDSLDEAVALCRSGPFGLAASIYTADAKAGEVLAERIPAGSVSINDVLATTAHPATPFGGRGASGWGVTRGAEGLLALTTLQTVTVRSGRFRPHLDDMRKPSASTGDILRGLLRLTHARGFRARFAGLRQLIAGIRRWK